MAMSGIKLPAGGKAGDRSQAHEVKSQIKLVTFSGRRREMAAKKSELLCRIFYENFCT
jgi:hypothetical protein